MRGVALALAILLAGRELHASCNLEEVYRMLSSDCDLYRPGQCSLNVTHLARKLASAGGLDLSKANVIYIFGDNDRLTVVRSSRTRDPDALWDYHVVLEYQGTILDLDAPIDSPPIPVETYLREISVSSDGAIRAIPFKVYERIYDTKERGSPLVNASYFQRGSPLDAVYPVIPFDGRTPKIPPPREAAPAPRPDGPSTVENGTLRVVYDSRRNLEGIQLVTNEIRYTLLKNGRISLTRNDRPFTSAEHESRFRERLESDAREDKSFLQLLQILRYPTKPGN